jgi:hypothetical protein
MGGGGLMIWVGSGSGSGVGAGVEGTEEVDASANCLG